MYLIKEVIQVFTGRPPEAEDLKTASVKDPAKVRAIMASLAARAKAVHGKTKTPPPAES